MQQAEEADSMFLTQFRTGNLPIETWDHHAHVRMCYLELLDQRDSCSSAVQLFATVADRIVHYYSQQSRFAGTFHATITGFWVQRVWDVVEQELQQGAPVPLSFGAFVAELPPEQHMRLFNFGDIFAQYSDAELFGPGSGALKASWNPDGSSV
jgi:hypothetical protein